LRHDRVSSLIAWAPVVWVLVTVSGVWLISTVVLDWYCGPPGEETCDLYGSHPGLLWYLRITAPLALACLVTSLVLAIRRKLSVTGMVGLALSAAVAAPCIFAIAAPILRA
jgi:hypothetical protein